jgi:hypothetical protein
VARNEFKRLEQAVSACEVHEVHDVENFSVNFRGESGPLRLTTLLVLMSP